VKRGGRKKLRQIRRQCTRYSGQAKNKDAKHKLTKERTSVATPLPTVSTVENPSTLGEKEKGLEKDRR